MHLKIFRVSDVFSVFGTLSACFFKHAKRCNALLNLELSSETSGYGWRNSINSQQECGMKSLGFDTHMDDCHLW
jgi:hypothetical protein